jgi:hypothetical protein
VTLIERAAFKKWLDKNAPSVPDPNKYLPAAWAAGIAHERERWNALMDAAEEDARRRWNAALDEIEEEKP